MFRKHKLLSLGFFLLSLSLFGQKYYTFSGVVKDSVSGVKLEGVDVVVKNQSTGTLTSDNGEFLLYLESGTYEIVFTCNGFKSESYLVDLSRSVTSEIKMKEAAKSNKNTASWLRKIENKNDHHVSGSSYQDRKLLSSVAR
jgi:hypothetical protein